VSGTKHKTNYATSLELALVACVLLALLCVCVYTDSCGGYELFLWAFFGPLLLMAACFGVRDVIRPGLRLQGVIALVSVIVLWVVGSKIFWILYL
jgi:hypothetical protein